MIGMEAAVKFVEETKAFAALHQEDGLSRDILASKLRLVVTGESGTGKTTLARLLHDIFFACGVLRRNQLVEITAADLKGLYVGHTTRRVQAKFKEARGGTLFIDEAYSIGEGSFADEVKTEMLAQLESHMNRDTLVVLAGYPDEMNRFLDSNQGLRGRFPSTLRLIRHSATQLVAMVPQMVEQLSTDRLRITVAADVLKKLVDLLNTRYQVEMRRKNSRLVKDMVNRAVGK